MNRYNLIKITLILGALAVVGWSTLSAHPPSFLPRQYDKIGHFGVFAACSFFIGCLLINLCKKRIYALYWSVFYGLAVFLEYAQGWWLPGRTFDRGDLIHNLWGVTAALIAWFAVLALIDTFFKHKPTQAETGS